MSPSGSTSVYDGLCWSNLSTGSDIEESLTSLRQYENNIWVISQVIQNDVSSTKVRLFLVSYPNGWAVYVEAMLPLCVSFDADVHGYQKKDLSVRYLIPDPVVSVSRSLHPLATSVY